MINWDRVHKEVTHYKPEGMDEDGQDWPEMYLKYIGDGRYCRWDQSKSAFRNPFRFSDKEEDQIALRSLVSRSEEEHTGLSVNYYRVDINKPTSGGDPYTAECNDIIEALNMTYAEGNVVKAIWRRAAERTLGKRKKGNNSRYDAEKALFFSERILQKEINGD